MPVNAHSLNSGVEGGVTNNYYVPFWYKFETLIMVTTGVLK